MENEMRDRKVLRILLLEDNPDDARLMEHELRKGKIPFQLTRTWTKDDFLREIDTCCPDLIISDYSLPSYDGLTALDDVRNKGVDVPYLFLSGTIGEEFAIETLKRGATDYVLKDHLSRLLPAIDRAMMEHDERIERRNAEESLRASEEKFKGLAASAQDAIIMIDGNEKISYWNNAAESVFGYTSDEAMGKGLHALIAPPQYAEASRKGVEHFCRTGEGPLLRKLLTLFAVRKDGTEFPVELTISPYQLRGEWHAISIMRDITERKEAEDLLRRSEKNLLRAQEIAHIGSWTWEIASNRIAWSDEIYRIFGLADRKLDITFEAFMRAVHAEDRERVQGMIDAALKGERPYEIDHRIVLPDGSIRTVHEQAEVIRDDSGSAVGMEGIVHDITARKESEEMLQRQLEHMTALRDIEISINSSLDVRVTLNVLLEKLTTLLKVDAADVLLLDADSLYLNYAAGRGFRTSVVQSTHVRLGKGLAGQAAYERKAVIFTNLTESLTYSLKGEEFESYIAMPLITQGKVKGVLEIFQRKNLKPTQEWMNFLELLAGQAAIAIDNASMFDSLQRFATELKLSYDATLEGWGRTLEFRHEDTQGHTERVTEMTLRLARLLGMASPELEQVRRGALLHDIGKISIPDSILLKPGPLTAEEREIMKRHTVYAQELLSGIPFLRPAIDIPYCHHEMWNGKGYPRGLAGEDIPFQARVFSVVDVADALISNRPYRAAWSIEKTYRHIASLKGTHFDPIVVEVFLDMKWVQ